MEVSRIFCCYFFRINFLFLLISGISGCHSKHEPPTEKSKELESVSIEKFDYSLIRPGDFILKRGKGPVSKLITDNFKEEVPISHCGIFVREGDSLAIIHSVTREFGDVDGVQRVDVSRFLRDCAAGYLYIQRFDTLPDLNEQMAARAVHYARQHVPFDKEVNNEDKEKMSCTELLYWCMKDVYGTDYFNRITINRKTFLGFAGLLDSARFTQVKRY